MGMRQLDRVQGAGGGCITFVKEGVPYTVVGIGREEKYVVVKVEAERKELVIVNYNPSRRLAFKRLEGIEGQCGDFNGHSTLWGSDQTNHNGQVIEDYMDEKNIVYLNDGRYIRVNMNIRKESVKDLTLVLSSIAP